MRLSENIRQWGGRGVLLIAVVALSAIVSLSQVDEEGQKISSSKDGDKLIYQITSPHVKESKTTFNLRFEEGDRVRVEAGGCVQTGGVGKTWKRYVNPSGPNSNNLYHGLIGIPYLTQKFPQSPNVKGLVRIQSLIGKEYVIPSYKDDSPEQFHLILGYEDDDYDDNGYTGHDDGTQDQCRNVGNAWVKITITHKAVR